MATKAEASAEELRQVENGDGRPDRLAESGENGRQTGGEIDEAEERPESRVARPSVASRVW
jgi:hypothetical protein